MYIDCVGNAQELGLALHALGSRTTTKERKEWIDSTRPCRRRVLTGIGQVDSTNTASDWVQQTEIKNAVSRAQDSMATATTSAIFDIEDVFQLLLRRAR